MSVASLLAWVGRAASLGAFVAGSGVALYAAGPPLGGGALEPLTVTAEAAPLKAGDPAADRLGPLRFLGALVLRSGHERFGGISGLLHAPACGRLLAVTDTGSFLLLEPQEEGQRLTGVARAWIAPVLDGKGLPPSSKWQADAEALALDPASGDLWVWFELDDRGQRYAGIDPCREETLKTGAAETWRPKEIAGWPQNGGVEAAGFVGGRHLILSESASAGPDLREGHLFAGGRSQRVAWPVSEGFEPTDLVALDDRTLLVLERRFSPARGAAARLARATIDPATGAISGKETLARFEPPILVDNFEALAVAREAGRTFLYVASDDNFNPLQRTLLLKFELAPG